MEHMEFQYFDSDRFLNYHVKDIYKDAIYTDIIIIVIAVTDKFNQEIANFTYSANHSGSIALHDIKVFQEWIDECIESKGYCRSPHPPHIEDVDTLYKLELHKFIDTE